MKNKLLLFILLSLSTLEAQDESEKNYKDLRLGISSALSAGAVTVCAFNAIKHADLASVYITIKESKEFAYLLTIQNQQKLNGEIIYNSLAAAAYFFGIYCILKFAKMINKDIPSSTEENLTLKKQQH